MSKPESPSDNGGSDERPAADDASRADGSSADEASAREADDGAAAGAEDRVDDPVEFAGGERDAEAAAADDSPDIEDPVQFGARPDADNPEDADNSEDSDNPEDADERDDAAAVEAASAAAAAGVAGAALARTAEAATPAGEPSAADEDGAPPADEPPRRRRSWLPPFNLLLILLLAAGAGYYAWWQHLAEAEARAEIAALRDDIARRAEASRLDSGLQALRGDIGSLDSRLGELDAGQQELRESTVRLFDLYGRNKNDWQLAEVEYLMKVAQHQLILTHDFEGAAATLQAANDRLGELADPGLLPVRVTISEEIAELKTRKRPDLVGMTLMLAQLARQVDVLRPGFEPLLEPGEAPPPAAPAGDGIVQDWLARLGRFVDSLVEVRYEPDVPPTLVEARAVDAGETLADTLKLARWAVLERDARQYDRLIAEAVRLTRSFYDLDHAANLDFLDQLTELQKMQLNPAKPDITGSLRELQRIVSERKNAPEEVQADG